MRERERELDNFINNCKLKKKKKEKKEKKNKKERNVSLKY